MFVTLPKSYLTTGDVPIFDGRRAIMKLTPVKGGVLLYEIRNGALIGQVFTDKDEATVSIAESKTFTVSLSGGKAVVVSKDTPYSYEIFGAPEKYEYKVFEYSEGKPMPELSAQVTANPLSDDNYCVFLNDASNLVRSLLIVAAIATIVGIKE